MNPLVSIIIPVYNAEAYLRDCLRSVLSQTYRNLEVILIDDGSRDRSGVICEEFATEDPRIRVIHQENSGVASARNAGIRAFTGDYAMFVDSDDTIKPDAVQTMLARIVSDGSDLVIAKHEVISQNGTVTNGGVLTNWMKDAVLTLNKIMELLGENKRFAHALWAKMYRKHILEGICVPGLRGGEDAAIFPEYISKCETISISEKTVYQYWNRENSITKAPNIETQIDMLKGNLRVLRFYIDTGYLLSAKKWFEYLMIGTTKIANKKTARNIILQELTKDEIKMLLKDQCLKVRVKWISLYIPIIYKIVRGIKDLMGLK